MIETRILCGGSTALIENVPGTRTLSIGFWFPFGSRHEGSGRRGYTHFIEHMLFKGTSRRSASDIAREIDRLGGYLNAFTEREAVCFYCTLPASSMETAVDILVDMVFSSTFPEGEFLKERHVILNEILSAQDDPEDISFDEYLEAIWPGSDMSAKIAGEAHEVKAIELEGLRSYYSRNFVPANLLVCAAGALDSNGLVDALNRSIENASETFRHGPADEKALLKGDAPFYNRIREYRRAPMQQVQLYAGLPFRPESTVEEYSLLSVFNCAFGESMSSRLFQNIREALGYCYSVYSFFSLASDIGLWTINGSSSERHFKPFLEAVMEEVRKAETSGLNATEVADAVLHLEGAVIMASEDMEHRMKRLARQKFHNGIVLEIEESLRILKGSTVDEVNAQGRKLLDVRGMSVFAYGSRRSLFSRIPKMAVTS